MAALFLGLGALSETSVLTWLCNVIVAAAFGALLMAILAALLAVREGRRANTIAAMVQLEQPGKPS
jgi:hypothetical protein